jgi:hypothetical protein
LINQPAYSKETDSDSHPLLCADAFEKEILRTGSVAELLSKKEFFKLTRQFPKKRLSEVLSKEEIISAKVGRAKRFLVKQKNLDNREKAWLWNELAKMLARSNEHWASTFHLGTDGSFVFVGTRGMALIITQKGAVYQGTDIFLKPGEFWMANYQDHLLTLVE